MPLACSRAAEHRRGGGREVGSAVGRVERRAHAGAPGARAVAATHEVRARELQPRTLKRHLVVVPPHASVV